MLGLQAAEVGIGLQDCSLEFRKGALTIQRWGNSQSRCSRRPLLGEIADNLGLAAEREHVFGKFPAEQLGFGNAGRDGVISALRQYIGQSLEALRVQSHER